MNLRRRLRDDLICHKVKTLDAGRREIEEFRGAERVVQIVASLLIPRIPQIVSIFVIDHTSSDLRQTQQPQPLLRVRACHTTPHAPPRLLHAPRLRLIHHEVERAVGGRVHRLGALSRHLHVLVSHRFGGIDEAECKFVARGSARHRSQPSLTCRNRARRCRRECGSSHSSSIPHLTHSHTPRRCTCTARRPPATERDPWRPAPPSQRCVRSTRSASTASPPPPTPRSCS